MKTQNEVKLNICFDKDLKEHAESFSESDITSAFINAVQAEISDKKRKGLPVARYDADKKKAYLENADGTREYVNG